MNIQRVGLSAAQVQDLVGRPRASAGQRGDGASRGGGTGPYGQRGSDPGHLGVKELTDQQILDQSRELLELYYASDPAARELVDRGVVPDYWGVQQTGQRIFDILAAAYGGEDPETFVTQATAILEAAYGDAERIFGALPDLVTRTRQALFDALTAIANGATLAEARAGIGAVA